MASEILVKKVKEYDEYVKQNGFDYAVVEAYTDAARLVLATDSDTEYGLRISHKAKKLLWDKCLHDTGGTVWDLENYCQQNGKQYRLLDMFYELLKIESRHRLESFLLYMEKNRPIKERFYQTRVKPLSTVVQAIQDLADDKLDELQVCMPPRVGKTQLIKEAQLWYGSRNTEKSNLYSAFSKSITSAYFDGLLELTTDPTYTYAEIFPENVKKKLITDALDTTIDMQRKKSYPTFTCRSIYGTLNGACDCTGLAVADDLFSGYEEAISEARQEKVWGIFDNNYMRRLKSESKLILMGTRWALKDVQGRRLQLLNENPEFADVRHKEVIIQALDEKTDESNFDYPYRKGYSTKEYRRIRASFEENGDIASWYAQCQQQPIERQGALFTVDTMRFFKPEDLPKRPPDRIFAAVDPAYGGGDFVAMPICYEYDGEYYIIDAVYNDGEKDVTIPEVTGRMAQILTTWAPKTAEVHFEDTKATDEFRVRCMIEWEKIGMPINATHSAAPTANSKKDRINNHAPEIRQLHFLERKYRTREYDRYFQNILTFKTNGKNKHDDGIDATAQLCDMTFGVTVGALAKCRAAKNPFKVW